MPNTVRMKKGNRFVDIYNSEECIANARKDGYELCDEKPFEMKLEEAFEKEINRPSDEVKTESEVEQNSVEVSEKKDIKKSGKRSRK